MKCFACGTLLDKDLDLRVKLLDLIKILKLPVTGIEISGDEEGKFCGNCCVVIKEAEEIVRHLEELERKLEKVQEQLRGTIAENLVFEEEGCQNGGSVESLIKKSFLECWEGLSALRENSSMNEDQDELNDEGQVARELENVIICESPSDDCEEGRIFMQDISLSVSNTKDKGDYCQTEMIKEGVDDSADKTNWETEGVIDVSQANEKCGSLEEYIYTELLGKDKDNAVGNTEMMKESERVKESSELKVELSETTHGGKDEFKCVECNKRLKDSQSLAIHIKRAHEGDMKPYECVVCKWKFASPSKLQSHAQSRQHSQIPEMSTSNEAPIDCPECFHQFKDNMLLEGHIKEKHQGIERPFECVTCKRAYKKRNHLHDHQRVAHGSARPFYCEWCNPQEKVSFSTQKKLDMHVLTKHRNNTCHICEKNFKTPYILTRHMNSHTNITSTDYICEICGAKYRALKRLKVHQMRHENKEPFSCDLCGRVFSEPRTLQHHKDSVHENKFKYHCEICGIGCQQIYMLNRHMMCHSSEKKFTCDVCGFKFKRKQQLVIHERKHTGEKPFKCRQCGKEFTEKKKLKNHEFVHGGEKPYQCSICSKQFALKHYLTHHINSYHKHPKKKSSSVNDKVGIGAEDLQLDQEITIDGGLILDQLGQKFVSVDLIDETQVIHEEIIAYDEGSNAQLGGGLVVGEWIQFGFVSN